MKLFRCPYTIKNKQATWPFSFHPIIIYVHSTKTYYIIAGGLSMYHQLPVGVCSYRAVIVCTFI